MFTAKAIVYFAFSLGLLTLALLADDFQIGVLVLGLASIFFLSNIWGLPEKIQVRLEREIIPDETFGDDNVRIESRVTNLTGTRLGNVEIQEILDSRIRLEKGTKQTFTYIPQHEESTLICEFPSPPRSIYQIGPLIVKARDPFGFYLSTKTLPAETLSVMPRPERLRAVHLRPRRVGPWPGVVPSRVLGSGSEFYSLREYATGDDPKRINWKASAHFNSLVINETEAERVTDVMIVLDTDVTFFGQTGNELFEQEVQATASLTRLLLRQGNRVGLVLQGGERGSVPAGFGKRHERRILYLLAAARPGRATVSTSYVMNLLAKRMLPLRSQIVIVSPLLDPELKEGVRQLIIAGYSLIILSPTPTTPAVFHDDTEETAFNMIMLERGITLLSLERSARVIDWPRGMPLSTIMSRGRRIRRTVPA